MDISLTKTPITACFDAKELVDMMSALPKGVTPLGIRISDTIEHLTREKAMPIPRDVAKERKLAMPSVTHTVKLLEKLNAVSKEMDHDDHRFFKLTLTPLGKKWYDIYVAHFYDAYAKELGDINEESALTTIKVITKMNQAMKIITKEDFYGRD